MIELSTAATWLRLAQAHVTAEQAEALGIIESGSLKWDVFALSGIDPAAWPAPRRNA